MFGFDSLGTIHFMSRPTVTVLDNPDRSRVEARTDDGSVAGFSDYERTPAGNYRFVHAEVDDAYEGQGVGGSLAQGVVDFVRRQQARLVPDCPFIRGWMSRHPETHDVLAEGASLA